MIKRLEFHRFKQFRDQSFELHPAGLSLVAGGNNCGKSSILHGLAVWQFCRTAIEMERGREAFLPGGMQQGIGLGDDEFSPINVPALNHLWTNIKSRKEEEPDGYTLKILCEWDDLEHRVCHLEFGLALSNDRLFIKTVSSNLQEADNIPQVAYLPPFAGITDREMRLPGAIRRRRVGEGLAGAVLRNLILDMYVHNQRRRAEVRGNRTKIRDADLELLRQTDPWELLQATLRQTFGAELVVSPFNEDYHSYIRIDVVKGTVIGQKLRRHAEYNRRDLMVEGSGLLQWISVYTLAVNPDINVLLLDEPDAHLHCSLQDYLINELRSLAERTNKQVMVATHSTEILRHAPVGEVFEVRDRRGRYLSDDQQKVGLLAGLGSEHAPRIDRLKRTRRLLFVEGRTDIDILRVFAERLGRVWPEQWVVWISPAGHKERKQVFLALSQEIQDLFAISLRDRDDEPAGSVGPDLIDRSHDRLGDFDCRKWRRRQIESYLVWPPAIAAASGLTEEEVENKLRNDFAIAIPTANFARSEVPAALRDFAGKAVFREGDGPLMNQFDVSAYEVALTIDREAVCEDISTFIDLITQRAH